ncbi:Eco57I restriction-modification methylase domain-containing protein [Aquimarina latercula]|uniref:Eco57I restriction-modification methylase domain-containing protein n=1 Tax=Aquimarina latercula TaxID=987 RepID=UPI00041DD01E|nr:SAM-dependent methyltransferase [Aquimarina latercula]
MQISITLHKALNRWELLFSEIPDKALELYLTGLGFRFHNTKPRLFHGPNQDAYKYLAEDLKKVLTDGGNYKDIMIKPSHTAYDSNITHNKFSYVTITYLTEKSEQKEHYVIFDQHAKIAEAIALQYGEAQEGKKVKSVEVQPRGQKRASRKLLDFNKVIPPIVSGEESVTQNTSQNAPTSPPKPEKPITLTNSQGVYTKETAKDQYQTIEVPIPVSAKYEAAIDIVEDPKDHFRFASSYRKTFGDFSGSSSPVSSDSPVVKDKKTAISKALLEIWAGLEKHITTKDTILGNEQRKHKLLLKAMKAIADFGTQHQVVLPKISVTTPTTDAKKPINKKKKTKNNTAQTYRKTIRSFIKKSRSLSDGLEDRATIALLETERIAFEDVLAIKSKDQFLIALKKVVQEQSYWISKIKDTYIQKKYNKLLTPLQELVGVSKSSPYKKRDAKHTIATNVTQKGIAHNDEHPQIEVGKTIHSFGIEIPNVLIPAGIYPPFDAGGIPVSAMDAIRKEYPHLFKIHSINLQKATALELFQIAQLPSPDTMGLKIQKDVFSAEFEKRGEDLWYGLGFPTATTYPYVSLYKGNIHITTLKDLIEKHSSWLTIARGYRPIADMKVALQQLDTKAQEYQQQLQELESKKAITKTAIKKLVADIEDTASILKDIEASRNVVKQYQDSLVSEDFPTEKNDVVTTVPKIEIPKKPTSFELVMTKDIISGDTLVQNVLIPTVITSPFDSGSIGISDKQDLQNTFGYLYDISDDTLDTASAKELFELSQLSHPTDYGIPVHRAKLLKQWEKRGKTIFEELGYPTDLQYPYVNRHIGYKSVDALEQILGDNRNQWWSVVEHYRPIADLSKALGIIDRLIQPLKVVNEEFLNPKTGKVKGAYKEIQRDHLWEIQSFEKSKTVIEQYQSTQKKQPSEPPTEKSKYDGFLRIPLSKAKQLRKDFKSNGFDIPFTGTEAFARNLTLTKLATRKQVLQRVFDEKIIKTLNESNDDELAAIRIQLAKEHQVFQDELFLAAMQKVEEKRLTPNDKEISEFQEVLLRTLLGDVVIQERDTTPVREKTAFLIDDMLIERKRNKLSKIPNKGSDSYIDKVVATMHNHYIEATHLSRKKIELLKDSTGTPNLGMLWEAVELSWLLWYKMYYSEPVPFENRLGAMIRFWDNVQPTYAYSDSSKEQYKQYSTPCPIAAMISEYTFMPKAESVFEPSAGNGLLVLGADPLKTHVNEIDKSRLGSLEFQKFATITSLNAAEPFPEHLHKSFDVMVTNPPFASWDADPFDKERMVAKYFHNHRRIASYMRLEHLMSGLALHTLKDSGKAALIIIGHVFFDAEGYIAKYRPFFNWLYRHYRVDDIINMNSFKLYNKQGATARTMLVLINGRKPKPKGTAPKKQEAPHLEEVVDSFEMLWERISQSIRTPIQILIQQLKIANRYDIF